MHSPPTYDTNIFVTVQYNVNLNRMDPLSIAGAGVGLASGVYGMFKSASAAKEQKKALENATSRENAWYNRNYYQNYLDSSESQAAIKRVEDSLKRHNQIAQGTAAVTGATPESVLAEQENSQKLMSDTVASLAARGDEKKSRIDMVHQQNMNNIDAQRIAQMQTSETGAASMAGAGMGLIGSALQGADFGKKKGA